MKKLIFFLLVASSLFGQFKFHQNLPDRYYKFYWNCEQAIPVDLSYSARSMTNTNATINSGCIFNNGFYFNQTAKIVLGNYEDFNFNTNFTIEFWFKDFGSPATSGIFSTNTAVYPLVIFANNSSNVTVGVSTSATPWNILAYTTSMGALSSIVFNHYCIERSGNDYFIFKNGVQQSVTTNSATVATVGAAEIGRYFSDTYFMKGYLDNFRISIGVARYPYGTNGVQYFQINK